MAHGDDYEVIPVPEQQGAKEQVRPRRAAFLRAALLLAPLLGVGAALYAAFGGSRRAEPRKADSAVDLAEQLAEARSGGAPCAGCAAPWDDDQVIRICEGRDTILQINDTAEVAHYPVGPGGNFMYYGSQNLSLPRIRARHLLLLVHGAKRNAQDYFCALKRLAEASILRKEDTLLIVPRFAALWHDHLPTDCVWNTSHPSGDWHSGGMTDPSSTCNVSSFRVLDDLLMAAGDRAKFPLLRDVRVFGFSAGGMTLQRYTLVSSLVPAELSSEADFRAGRGLNPDLRVTYAIGGASSYAYLDGHRWTYDCASAAAPAGCTPMVYAPYKPQLGRGNWTHQTGFLNPNLTNASAEQPFVCSDETFNEWEYGLSHAAVAAAPLLRAHPDLPAAVHRWYPSRHIIFFVGLRDTCTGYGLPFCFASCWSQEECHSNDLDMGCRGMLQGPTRLQRAIHFVKHLEHFYGRKVHPLYQIPEAGHEAERVFMQALYFLKLRQQPQLG